MSINNNQTTQTMKTKMNEAFKSGLKQVELKGIFSEAYFSDEILYLIENRIKDLKMEIFLEEEREKNSIKRVNYNLIVENKKIIDALEAFINPFKTFINF
jgi:CRISPR/Cas system-associated exonuclease Cas4 (RecB family)